jgi:hypothetical protein
VIDFAAKPVESISEGNAPPDTHLKRDGQTNWQQPPRLHDGSVGGGGRRGGLRQTTKHCVVGGRPRHCIPVCNGWIPNRCEAEFELCCAAACNACNSSCLPACDTLQAGKPDTGHPLSLAASVALLGGMVPRFLKTRKVRGVHALEESTDGIQHPTADVICPPVVSCACLLIPAYLQVWPAGVMSVAGAISAVYQGQKTREWLL